jgi:hypothetical protein
MRRVTDSSHELARGKGKKASPAQLRIQLFRRACQQINAQANSFSSSFFFFVRLR